MPVTILLADQYPIVREGLKTILGTPGDFRVLGETGDGLEAMQLVASLYPDLLIVGIMLSGLNGLEVTRQVHRRVPHTRVIILSRYTNERYIRAALHSGAAGYVFEGSNVNELLQAVRDVAAGQRYISPILGERIIQTQAQRARTGVLDLYETLTRREYEVLRLVTEGHTNMKIAAILGISSRTVETHRAHLMQKLGLRTQVDLIRYALQHGIVPPQ